MSGPVSFPTSASNFRCLQGLIVRAEQFGFIQRGTHRLLDAGGRMIAALRSNQVNLNQFEGQFRTVCGLDEGEIEGVTSLLVTQVVPVNTPGGGPPPPPAFDPRLFVLLMLLQRFGWRG